MNTLTIVDENFNYHPCYQRCLADENMGFDEMERWLYNTYKATFSYHPKAEFMDKLEFESEEDMMLFLLRYS